MYSIREMSVEFGLTPRTIRFYEQKSLLKPSRDATISNVPRIFNEEDRAQLAEIVKLTKMGFTLNEIASGDMSADRYRQQLAFCLDQIAELQEAISLLKERLRTD
ncbi:DNA-binding transcriptional MerR regulator [Bosea sp. OAE506]|uniref:MerR family transcriptional regulator n=1 Tax=Bosea sp. OAE506 TaxID=2663870 RepID=UPI00178972AA